VPSSGKSSTFIYSIQESWYEVSKLAEANGRTKLPKPMDNAVAIGVVVDDFGLTTNKHFAVLDGIIVPPRSEEPMVAARMIFPVSALIDLQKALGRSIKQYEERFNTKLVNEKDVKEIGF
jgi:hypothetical protein